ncbi:MAG: heavy metal translocating P-type ATPase, partial [Ruminococcaceae bacterium]|nr:heavy metal translocating P-type ATPase [Oscillospiraceae bacterium]
MDTYNITGMSCAACSARVETAVSSLRGVDECSVNLLTNSMTVSGNISYKEVIKAVEKAGYGATLKDGAQNEVIRDMLTPTLKKRLIFSLVFLVILMYFSMFHTMWHFPLPTFLSNNPFAISVIQLTLTVVVMILNRNFFVSGFKGVIHKAPNMDTLVSIGSLAGFIYSVTTVAKIGFAQFSNDFTQAFACFHDLYFESSAMILALVTFGKMLEAKAKGKTTNALKRLMELSPKTATLIIDGIETEVSAAKVKIGDIFIVKPGQSVAVDGIVLEGFSAIDESMLSGESIPVEKQVGDTVSSGTINQSGFLKCQATAVGNDTAISQIVKMVSDAAATKAPIAKIADKVSGYFVPTVIIIALITTIVWLICGQTVGFALARGISVLVISCPCALGLATPVAIMVSNGKGAKNGILFKNSVALENIGKAQIICF